MTIISGVALDTIGNDTGYIFTIFFDYFSFEMMFRAISDIDIYKENEFQSFGKW
jgi:hypothetical protein